MAEGLKGRALFKAIAGCRPGEDGSFSGLVDSFGGTGLSGGEAIQEIDVNPLLVVQGEPIAVDASIILR